MWARAHAGTPTSRMAARQGTPAMALAGRARARARFVASLDHIAPHGEIRPRLQRMNSRAGPLAIRRACRANRTPCGFAKTALAGASALGPAHKSARPLANRGAMGGAASGTGGGGRAWGRASFGGAFAWTAPSARNSDRGLGGGARARARAHSQARPSRKSRPPPGGRGIGENVRARARSHVGRASGCRGGTCAWPRRQRRHAGPRASAPIAPERLADCDPHEGCAA